MSMVLTNNPLSVVYESEHESIRRSTATKSAFASFGCEPDDDFALLFEELVIPTFILDDVSTTWTSVFPC